MYIGDVIVNVFHFDWQKTSKTWKKAHWKEFDEMETPEAKMYSDQSKAPFQKNIIQSICVWPSVNEKFDVMLYQTTHLADTV